MSARGLGWALNRSRQAQKESACGLTRMERGRTGQKCYHAWMKSSGREQPQVSPSLQKEYALWCAALLDSGQSLPVHGRHCEGHPLATDTVLDTPEYLRVIEHARNARPAGDIPPLGRGAANDQPTANPKFNFQRIRLAEAAAAWCREGRNGDFLLLPGQQLLEGKYLLNRCRDELTAQEIIFVEASVAASSSQKSSPVGHRHRMTLAGLVLVLALAAAEIWRFYLPLTAARRTAPANEDLSRRPGTAVLRETALSPPSTPPPDQPPVPTADSLVAEAVEKWRAGEALAVLDNLPGALAAYRESLVIQQRLVALEPRNLARQQDLADGWTRVADLLQSQDRAPDAIAAYHEAETITRVRAAALPDDLDLQHHLFADASMIGNLLFAQNDFPGALTAFRRAVATAQKEGSRHPEDLGWRRDLSVGLQNVSDAFERQGDHEEARRQSGRARNVRQKIVEADPTDTEARRDLTTAEWKVGDLMLAQADADGALPHYAAALAIQQSLAAQDASRIDWQRDLATAYERLGQALLAKGELAGPEEAFTHCLDIRRKLLAQDATNPEWRHDAFLGLIQLGDAQALVSNLPAALKSYREALHVEQQLSAAAAGDVEWQNSLAETQDKIGQILEAQEAPIDAMPFYRDALATYERLAMRDPADEFLKEPVATVSYHLGRAAARRQPADVATAKLSLQHARDILLHLRAVEGDTPAQRLADALEDTERLLAQMEH